MRYRRVDGLFLAPGVLDATDIEWCPLNADGTDIGTAMSAVSGSIDAPTTACFGFRVTLVDPANPGGPGFFLAQWGWYTDTTGNPYVATTTDYLADHTPPPTPTYNPVPDTGTDPSWMTVEYWDGSTSTYLDPTVRAGGSHVVTGSFGDYRNAAYSTGIDPTQTAFMGFEQALNTAYIPGTTNLTGPVGEFRVMFTATDSFLRQRQSPRATPSRVRGPNLRQRQTPYVN